MKQAYKDLFSVEPFASLKDYFNVYYINVLPSIFQQHDEQSVESERSVLQCDIKMGHMVQGDEAERKFFYRKLQGFFGRFLSF
jgi:hypothetical protein